MIVFPLLIIKFHILAAIASETAPLSELLSNPIKIYWTVLF